MEKYYFNHLNISKNSVVFTWDDNFSSHYDIIAPIFLDYNYRCTFYINPGENNFINLYYKGYQNICNKGFELGSHGYTHHHFGKYSFYDFAFQLNESRKIIQELFSVTPSTFAFPHHDSTNEKLEYSKSVYLETRNSLKNSKRFSLKTNTNTNSILHAIEDSANKKYTLVFSGHSILNDVIDIKECGYEPIRIRTLITILEALYNNKDIEVCTFEQSCLKTYIVNNCKYNNSYFELTENHKKVLENFGLNEERIIQII